MDTSSITDKIIGQHPLDFSYRSILKLPFHVFHFRTSILVSSQFKENPSLFCRFNFSQNIPQCLVNLNLSVAFLKSVILSVLYYDLLLNYLDQGCQSHIVKALSCDILGLFSFSLNWAGPWPVREAFRPRATSLTVMI